MEYVYALDLVYPNDFVATATGDPVDSLLTLHLDLHYITKQFPENEHEHMICDGSVSVCTQSCLY